MKFFKSTLIVVALLAANSLFAARAGAKKTTTTTVATAPVAPAAEVVALTYPQMLAKIKTMPPAQVVDKTGNALQPAFIQSIVDNPNLSSDEAKALLQAAVNVHATWSGNDAKDKAKLQSLDTQITKTAQQVSTVQATMGKQRSLMQSMLPTLGHVQAGEKAAKEQKTLQQIVPYQPEKQPESGQMVVYQPEAGQIVPYQPSITAQKQPLPSFYDPKTNLFNESILENTLRQELSKGQKTLTELLDILHDVYFPPMLMTWASLNLDSKVLLPALDNQVNAVIARVVKESPRLEYKQPRPFTRQQNMGTTILQEEPMPLTETTEYSTEPIQEYGQELGGGKMLWGKRKSLLGDVVPAPQPTQTFEEAYGPASK